MDEAAVSVGSAVIFIIAGGFIGSCLVLLGALVVPRVLARMSPGMNEEREIAGGNRAVADYFGRVAGATIIGVSIVIAAAIFAGIIALLY